MLFNRQIDLVFHLLVVSFSRDFINKKNEKGHLLKITRRSYTADHTASTACLCTRFTRRVLGITRKNDAQITGYHPSKYVL